MFTECRSLRPRAWRLNFEFPALLTVRHEDRTCDDAQASVTHDKVRPESQRRAKPLLCPFTVVLMELTIPDALQSCSFSQNSSETPVVQSSGLDTHVRFAMFRSLTTCCAGLLVTTPSQICRDASSVVKVWFLPNHWRCVSLEKLLTLGRVLTATTTACNNSTQLCSTC